MKALLVALLISTSAFAETPFAETPFLSTKPAEPAMRAWKLSLAPLAVSQSLDMVSSYGMRERNPLLANSNQRFDAQSALLKVGIVGTLAGVEYLVLRHHPAAARAFARLNWVSSGVTLGVAAHNFSIR